MINELKQSMQKLGMYADCVSIDSIRAQNTMHLKLMISKSDRILIGYPMYGSRAPHEVVSFVEKLPEITGKRISVFISTSMSMCHEVPMFGKLLENKGYVFGVESEFVESNSMNIPDYKERIIRNSKAKTLEREVRVKKWASSLTRYIGKEKRNTGVVGFIVNFIKASLRKFLWHTQESCVNGLENEFKWSLEVDQSLCMSCNHCMSKCPCNNIKRIDEDLKLGKYCAGCLRCYHHCPTQAIVIKEIE